MSLPYQVHLGRSAQDLLKAGFENLQRRGLNKPSGQPVPVPFHPQNKEVLPCIQTGLPMFQFVPIALYSVAEHHWKDSGSIVLTPTLEIFLSIYKVPLQPSLLQAKQAQLPQPFLIGEMLQSLELRSRLLSQVFSLSLPLQSPACQRVEPLHRAAPLPLHAALLPESGWASPHLTSSQQSCLASFLKSVRKL